MTDRVPKTDLSVSSRLQLPGAASGIPEAQFRGI